MATITGTAGDDNFTATPGDTISGGAGNDTLTIDLTTFPHVADYLNFYFVDNTHVYARLRKSDGSDDHYVTYLNFDGIENFNITGTSNQDNITAWASGNTTIHAGAGPDFFTVTGTGHYLLDGGDGQDYLYFDPSLTSGLTVDLNLTTPQTVNAALAPLTLIGIEGVDGTNYADTLSGSYLKGNGGNDTLTGGSSDDQLYGGDGNDVLTGGAGMDSLWGDAGNDRLDGGAGGGSLDGGAGDDTLIGGDGADWLLPGEGNDTVDGGAGRDILSYREDKFGVTVNLALGTASGSAIGTDTLTGIEDVSGGFGNDILTGNADNNELSGQEGDDVLIGGAGDDRLWAGPGRNTMEGGPGNDTFFGDEGVGGNGNDTVSYEHAAGGVSADLSIATAQAVGGGEGSDLFIQIENLTGSAYDDTLTGSAGDNILAGGAGNDRLSSGDGIDVLIGGAGNDTLDGGVNVDTATFSGNSAAYTVTQTSTSNFTIAGPDGTDTLANVEYAKFDDKTIRLLPGSGTTPNWSADPSTYMGAIRDFDGNDLGGAASWKLIGSADVNGDGRAEHILFNREIGRWAEVGTEADDKTYFANNGWAGDTRVVGIYIDPLVANGTVVKGSDVDSQRRFQNDLKIDNIHGILGQADYDHNGLQEVYFSLTDGTAYLHAYMHADGNIQYANYQNKQQVIDYLTANGVASSTWSNWFPASQGAMALAIGT